MLAALAVIPLLTATATDGAGDAMVAEPPPPPPPRQIAVLQAPGHTSTPGWLLTVDAWNNLLLDPKVHSDVPPDSSVQLWTHHETEPAPRSLGLIDPNLSVAVPATILGPIQPDQIFEMTLEPAGGSASGTPTGPILFLGRAIMLP